MKTDWTEEVKVIKEETGWSDKVISQMPLHSIMDVYLDICKEREENGKEKN